MLGKQNRQTSLMDIQAWINTPLVDPSSIYGLLADWGERLIADEDFAQMYSATGRPSVSPALLSKVLLLMYHDRVTDREAQERAKYDLRWKAALQLSFEEHGFDYTALSRFRTRLLTNNQHKKVFERFLELAKKSGIIQAGSLQIIDSTNILGAAAVKDTYTLIKTAIQKLLSVSRKKQGQAYKKIQNLKLTVDYSKKEKENIDWDNPEVRQQYLQNLINDSKTLLKEMCETELTQEERATVEILATVTEQDIETSSDGKTTLRQGVAKDRIISVHDTEMRHGHKTSTGKFNGYKGQIIIDENSEIITNIDVTPGNQADADVVDEILETSIVKPGILMGDTAYGTLAAREQMEKQNIVPVAPLPMGKSKPGKLDKYKFEINWEKASCHCPGGQSTVKTYKNKQGDITSFVFDKTQCTHCPLQEQCTKPGKRKVLTIHPQEQKRREIINQTNSREFKVYYRRRAKVERKIFHVICRGMRKTRYIGKSKTLIQLAFTSAIVNLKRLFTLFKGEVSAFLSFREALN